MIRTIAVAILIVVGAVLLLAATKPDTFRVKRSTSIHASPDKIFALLSDFHVWDAWSPWEKMDPAMKRSFSGAVQGPGAVYAWQGNSKVGAGRMEITEAAAPSKLAIDLDFFKPLETRNKVEFTLAGKGSVTTVTWSMYGPASYLSKVIHVFFDMDSMVGTQFETGLANLKVIAEK